MEDEIDLREYVEVLIKWWREILLLSVLAAVVAGGAVLALELLRTPLYEASATVAMVRVKSDITFDERYRTLSEEDLQALSGATRRSALVGLVLSSSVAEAVLEEVGARLDVAERNPAVLLGMVDAAILTPENGRGESDLIRITVTSADPEQAATIANAWARHYVQQVNDLYGSVPAELMVSVQKDLEQAQAAYDAAQGQLEVFMAENGTDRLQRLITEKEAIIESLQAGKQMAVQSLINEELTARQEIVAAYIDALAKNRLLAFQKEQEAKQQIVGKYIDSEVKSRLVAIERDRHAREEIYNRLADAELQSVMSVFDEQLQDHLSQLSQRYAEKQRLERLLANARNLQAQVVEGGDAAAQTNGVALLLLKTQVVSSQVSSSQVVSSTTSFEPLPVNLHLNIDTIPGSELTAAQQQADLAALVEVLDNRIDELSSEIQAQSERLLAGDTYLLLDRIDPGQLAVASAVTSGGGVQAETESSVGSLKTAILQRYQDLYKVGGLAEQGQQLALESELFEEIRTLYPELFQLDELSQLGEAAPGESPLALLGEEEAKQLLQLQGLDELASYGAADEAVSQAIDRMEMELQNLRAQHEAQKAQEQQLTQQRDLAWSTFLTLSNKNAELSLSNTAANSEVRFAAPAIPALEPVEGPNLVMVVALATVVGLMLAIFIAFFANFMGADPFLASRRRAAIQG